MIKYSLQCPDGHRFDSWFADAGAYDALAARGHLSCAVCGSGEIRKSVMAPRLATSDAPEPLPERPLSAPHSPAEQALSELKKKIEESSDYVGKDFVREARAIHEGEAPARPIHGEAKVAEARKLLEEGIPVAPLPFTPGRKTS